MRSTQSNITYGTKRISFQDIVSSKIKFEEYFLTHTENEIIL